MTSLHLLVADLRHAELRLLGCQLVMRQSHVRAYPKHFGGLPCHPSTFFDHEFRPLLLSRG